MCRLLILSVSLILLFCISKSEKSKKLFYDSLLDESLKFDFHVKDVENSSMLQSRFLQTHDDHNNDDDENGFHDFEDQENVDPFEHDETDGYEDFNKEEKVVAKRSVWFVLWDNIDSSVTYLWKG